MMMSSLGAGSLPLGLGSAARPIGRGTRCCVPSRDRKSLAVLATARGLSQPEGIRSGSGEGCPFSQFKLASLGHARAPAAVDSVDGFTPTPGPSAFSLESLGDVVAIFKHGLHAAMLDFASRYGPVCRFANPAALNAATGWVFVNSPTDVQHICASNQRNYEDRYLPDIYAWVTRGKGILGSTGDYNRRHRRLCQPPFRSKALLARFGGVVVDRASAAADVWEAAGQPVRTDVAVQTQRLTLDIVGLCAFGHDFQQTSQIARELGKGATSSPEAPDRLLWAVNTFGEVLGRVFITPMAILRAADAVGFPALRTLEETVGVMRESMLGVVAERRAAATACGGGRESQDLLDALLAATDDDGVGMTDAELWEDIHDVMGAGHETTATTAAAALHSVATHPEVEATLLEELRSVLGDRPPTYADLERLPYLGCVVREVLRLYPAIPIFPRIAAAEDRLPSGHRILPGDVVFMSSYALHRWGEVWPEPLKFDPRRFDERSAGSLHPFQWMPFGGGLRMCLGPQFAQMSVSLMVATLMQRLRFTAVKPTSQLIPISYDITLNFEVTGGLHMDVSPRTAD